MIEKLKTIDPYSQEELDMSAGSLGGLVYENTPLIQTVNQLVDAVNELQKKYDNVCIWVGEQKLNYNPDTTKGLSTLVEEPVDQYAEQRKWIGKLCKFWDDSDNPENCVYDVLCNIFGNLHHEDCPFQCGNGEWYEYCEPVKPDDDIIYKGE